MAGPEAESIAVVAEKPSVARDIARVLGAGKQGQGYLHGNGYVVTWAIGHLAALAQPHEIDPEWRHWRRNLLPMLPRNWPLVVYEKTRDQFEVVRRILTSPRISSVVCATDAGREGELIFRYIYEAAGCQKPFRRLWISSLTPEAIREGLASLKPGSAYNALADAARGRSRADWLVGMNLSRAYALAYGEKDLSVGRVQTPTLAMMVEREQAIRKFVPEDYLEVRATFHPKGGAEDAVYQGMWIRERGQGANAETLQAAMRLPADGEEAQRIAGRARSGEAAIESIEAQTQRMPPPALYDLTELQRHANRLYGFSAQKTLDTAQALYERHKLISYPRTDSRHLSEDVARTLGRIVKVVEGPYLELIAPGTGERPLGRRYVDDSKVTDHHAIIPTITPPERASLAPEEHKIYDLICRRLLSAWHDDHIWQTTTVITAIRNGEVVDRYHTSGSTVRQVGWKALDIAPAKPPRRGKGEEPEETRLPPGIERGQRQDVRDVEILRKKTRPPKRFTDATLLTAMETAGKTLDDRELSDAMKENGLGTPATRAAIIEVLVKRNYIVRDGKSLQATDKGIRLIEVVHADVKSPVMTGQWEAYLHRIHKGTAELGPFLKGIEEYVTRICGLCGSVDRTPERAAAPPAAEAALSAAAVRETTPADRAADLLPAFGFSQFRPGQEEVCHAVIEGRDALLVMPTGGGKSLCYQLPGIARGGTTLVISPLIALMEDQAARLRGRGFAVARIHSGRDRAESRQACVDYLNGNLQFLFIAPERLRITGFPEMLEKRKPALVAIDEAHCISQWGHDFRPDYRMIGQHLPKFRPCPVIAMTATATPIVQDDIARQLGLENPARFIRGFRRDNLAIEVVEIAQAARSDLACALLKDAERRPAIVYVPTRSQATTLAATLRALFPCDAYHAGLDAAHRDRVQKEFQTGALDVMVATIAFGMGIDKPDIRTIIHTALPGSLEGYYQEIGRAGRDGKPSHTILMHSWVDRKTHDYFFERDYPDVTVLDALYEQLTEAPQEKGVLQARLRKFEDDFDKALEKLWIHGGAVVDFAENVSRGHDHWREPYLQQAEQKRRQLELMQRYAESSQCRMAALVRYFGDRSDARKACGKCDFCAPADCLGQRFRPATAEEADAASRIVEALRGGSRPTGRLHSELFPDGQLARNPFEEVLGSMARAGWVRLEEAVFEKDGREIPYRKAALTSAGESLGEGAAAELLMKSDFEDEAWPRRGRKSKKRRPREKRAARTPREKPVPIAATAKAKPPLTAKPSPKTTPSATALPDAAVEEALRKWRLEEARRRGVPAFRIFTDQTLKAIAARRPRSVAELLAIPGIGMSAVEKHGAQIYRILGGG